MDNAAARPMFRGGGHIPVATIAGLWVRLQAAGNRWAGSLLVAPLFAAEPGHSHAGHISQVHLQTQARGTGVSFVNIHCAKDNVAVVGNEPSEMDEYQAYLAYRRRRGRWIREWLLPLLCFAAILTLSQVAARQWYYITDHELRLCVQIGMTMAEATEAFGGAPGSVWRAPFDGQRDGWPRSFKDFEDGTIALFSRIWPSSYLWVHFDRQGRVDRTFFVRS